VGVRNSVDKSFPLGFCAGARVFICDNLAFRSELLVKRPHTINGERRFNQAIAEAVSQLSSLRGEARWVKGKRSALRRSAVSIPRPGPRLSDGTWQRWVFVEDRR
jgi:hypothetical protein